MCFSKAFFSFPAIKRGDIKKFHKHSFKTTTTTTDTTLPQTGNNTPNVFIITVSAVMLTLSGVFVMMKSGIVRKRKTDLG